MWWYYALVAALKKVKFKIGDAVATATGGTPASGDRGWFNKYTCGKTGVYTTLRLKTAPTGNASGDNWKGVVYASDGAGGGPGTLLGVTAPKPNPSAAGAIVDLVFSPGLSLVNGTIYWIGWVSDSFRGSVGDTGVVLGSGFEYRCESLTYASPANNPTVTDATGSTQMSMELFFYA